MPTPFITSDAAVFAVRAVVAAQLVIHGVTRLSIGGVNGFGDYLASSHIPAGHALAWLITLVEIAGGITLAAGRFVVPLSLWFVAVLVAGIVMVHAPSGWFVVGAGRNGVEYSVVLIACLLITAAAGKTQG